MHCQQDIDYRRVAGGIDYIAAHFRDGPELADIAAAGPDGLVAGRSFCRRHTTGGAVANRRKNNTCWLLIYLLETDL